MPWKPSWGFGKEALFRALAALLDPKAPWGLRRQGLCLYAAFLLGLQGGVLLPLALLLPQASHPLLWALALAGAGGLFLRAQMALREESPLAPVVAVGLGVGLFFFLGVMGLLLRPWGLGLLPVGAMGFLHLLRRSEGALKGPGGGPGPGP
ncbi:hypothetical protein [Thermus thermamylovorans]|uniref:Uncharacterized protein n=1 Tax=Thermus thermamylovorans TaxID=2509362 RepID=A0A4Q9B7G8_9DEIN|nr:hypothetical protein [Thermus thermamylovorans]TBH21759.1 hypothetical protein ETP66_00520 [Thermus thermamylovorans]